MRKITLAVAAMGIFAMTVPAYAHVSVQPNEAVAGSFSRFVVRVPTEKAVPTTAIRLELPPLAFLSFEDKAGWTRTEETGKFDEPLDAFGQTLTKGVVEVTWSGGEIGPQEFAEFGFSAAMPEGEETLEFKAYQTYQGGEVVKWTGAPESAAPAARVTTYDIGAEEGQGQLGVLAELSQRVEQVESQSFDPDVEPETETDPAPTVVADDDDGDEGSSLGVILGGIGAGLGLIALIVALSRRKA